MSNENAVESVEEAPQDNGRIPGLGAGGGGFLKTTRSRVIAVSIMVLFASVVTFMLFTSETPHQRVQAQPPDDNTIQAQPESVNAGVSTPTITPDEPEVDFIEPIDLLSQVPDEPELPQMVAPSEPSTVDLLQEDRFPPVDTSQGVIQGNIFGEGEVSDLDPFAQVREQRNALLIEALSAPTSVGFDLPVTTPPASEVRTRRSIAADGLPRGFVLSCVINHNITIDAGSAMETPTLLRCGMSRPAIYDGVQRLPANTQIIGQVRGVKGERIEAVADELQIGGIVYPMVGTFISSNEANGVAGLVNRRLGQRTLLSLLSGLTVAADGYSTYLQQGERTTRYVPAIVGQRVVPTTDSEGNPSERSEDIWGEEPIEHVIPPTAGATIAGQLGSNYALVGAGLIGNQLERLAEPIITVQRGATLGVVLLDDWSPSG